MILEPLEKYGKSGINMARASGVVHRCHPLFAIYACDYPEQLLVTGSKNCPKGYLPSAETGDPPCTADDSTQPPFTLPNCSIHKPNDVRSALKLYGEDDQGFLNECNRLGIKAIANPFWKQLPYANVFLSITPDILHQLYQGMTKHLIEWLQAAYMPYEIDARCQRMPLNHCIRLFARGLSPLSRISGKEHRQICAILLGLIVDLKLPGGQSPKKIILATRALLDFLYLAQFPVHSAETLAQMALCLNDFHINKQIFIDLGIREDFNIPKLHGLSHYYPDISLFGTTDNYNTEQFERLHIDMAKDAYHATNHKNEYPQMTVWLERKEKIQRHDAFVKHQLAITAEVDTTTSIPSNPSAMQPMQELSQHPLYLHPTLPRYPSKYGVSLDSLTDNYGTSHFADGLADFVIKFNNPQLTTRQVQNAASDLLIPFQRCSVFHCLKLRDHNNQVKDTVHAQPEHKNKEGCNVPGRFDTVLVKVGSSSEHSIRSMVLLPYIY
jgi:hypothetical protein